MHSPHPVSGTQPQTAGGNPTDRADAAEPNGGRAGAGSTLPSLRTSVGEHVLTPQGPMGQAGGLMSLMDKGTCIASLYPQPCRVGGMKGQTT